MDDQELGLLINIIVDGMKNAQNNPRKNAEWDIIWSVKMPSKEGECPCEIVIGDRHTEFEPYVAWHCFNGNQYTWGHYCKTFAGALYEAIGKIKRELGLN